MVNSRRYENVNLGALSADMSRDLAKDEGMLDAADVTNLHLTKEEFMARMQKESDGWPLMDLMEKGEWRVCERMGFINGYHENDVVYFDIPSWNNLLGHLRIVNSI